MSDTRKLFDMKRLYYFITTIITLLICTSIHAQHKPLKHIDVPDEPIYKMGYDSRNNLAETINYYTVSAHLGSIAVTHAKGIAYPDLNHNVWELRIRLHDKEKFLALTQAKEIFNEYWEGSHSNRLVLNIGESDYYIDSWSLSGEHLFIELHKDVIKHIGISGLQCIYSHQKDNVLFEYSDITQEFWRRCANNVYEGRKNL